jgi:hypothetical protein
VFEKILFGRFLKFPNKTIDSSVDAGKVEQNWHKAEL